MGLSDIVRGSVERLSGYDLYRTMPEPPIPREELLTQISGIPEIDERIWRNQLSAHYRRGIHCLRFVLARITPIVQFTGAIAVKTLLPESQLEGFDIGDKYLLGGLGIHALDYLIFDMITPALRRRRSLQNAEIPDSY
ncbi:MAG TPA: hypothetical protein VI612_02045 [Candidatus Nanoarchaeia archaeon]|nr:hypothetical protein [Candidatus Nanoarchaeia archaeon]